MRNLIKKYMLKKHILHMFCLFVLFFLTACSKNIHMKNYQGSGSLTGTIWYTIISKTNNETKELPLLVQSQWKDSTNANLAFIFLHGVVFAECSITNNTLNCKSNTPLVATQNMIIEMATLTTKAINSMQLQKKFNQHQFMQLVPTQAQAQAQTQIEFKNKEFLKNTKNAEIKLIVNDFITHY